VFHEPKEERMKLSTCVSGIELEGCVKCSPLASDIQCRAETEFCDSIDEVSLDDRKR
jgi:hypothetical protein